MQQSGFSSFVKFNTHILIYIFYGHNSYQDLDGCHLSKQRIIFPTQVSNKNTSQWNQKRETLFVPSEILLLLCNFKSWLIQRIIDFGCCLLYTWFYYFSIRRIVHYITNIVTNYNVLMPKKKYLSKLILRTSNNWNSSLKSTVHYIYV